MANPDGNIPENCEKVLFAEDVVRCFFSEILNADYQPLIASPYREFIYEAFSDTMKRAMLSIYRRIKTYRIIFMIEEENLNRGIFKRFARCLRKLFFKKGFDAKLFLFYCVHLAMASTKLVTSIGLQRAGNLAVRCIVRGISKFDMLLGGWDTLNILAEIMASIEDYTDSHSPDYEVTLAPENEYVRSSSSDEEESDDFADDENSDGNDDAVPGGIHLDELKGCLEVDKELESQATSETVKLETAEVAKTVVSHEELENVTKGDTSEENSKYIKSPCSVQLSDKGSTSSNDENKAECQNNERVKDSLAPESENNAVSLQGKRSPKHDTSEENSKYIKSSCSVQLSDKGSTSSNDDIKAECQNNAREKDSLAPESENSAVSLQGKRSPKRDHKGSIISRPVQALDMPSTSSYFNGDGDRQFLTSVTDSESKIEQPKEDTPSFDENGANASKKSKMT